MKNKHKIGVSKTGHTNEARPLGTKNPAARKSRKLQPVVTTATHTEGSETEKILAQSAESPCAAPESGVELPQTPESNDAQGTAQQNETLKESTHMDTVTLNRDNKTRRSTSIVYTGTGFRGSVRVSKSAFLNAEAPATLEVPTSWPLAQPKQKVTETKEERKARLASLPKPTLAEKIAKRESQLAALKAKFDKAQHAEMVNA